jgi:hypothetical protein
MSEVLKFSQFSQHNRVPKVNIRRGRVDPKLDTQRPAQRKLLAQFALIDDLRRALFQQRKGFVRLHATSIPSFRAKSRNPVVEARSSFAGCLDFARHDGQRERYLFLFNNSRTCSIVSGSFFLLSDF